MERGVNPLMVQKSGESPVDMEKISTWETSCDVNFHQLETPKAHPNVA